MSINYSADVYVLDSSGEHRWVRNLVSNADYETVIEVVRKFNIGIERREDVTLDLQVGQEFAKYIPET